MSKIPSIVDTSRPLSWSVRTQPWMIEGWLRDRSSRWPSCSTMWLLTVASSRRAVVGPNGEDQGQEQEEAAEYERSVSFRGTVAAPHEWCWRAFARHRSRSPNHSLCRSA